MFSFIYLILFSLHIKEEAGEFLEFSTLDEIIRKYSQFINFNIYLWKSNIIKEEVPDEDGKIKILEIILKKNILF
jgi:HSP90 family molecular chaperone